MGAGSYMERCLLGYFGERVEIYDLTLWVGKACRYLSFELIHPILGRLVEVREQLTHQKGLAPEFSILKSDLRIAGSTTPVLPFNTKSPYMEGLFFSNPVQKASRHY